MKLFSRVALAVVAITLLTTIATKAQQPSDKLSDDAQKQRIAVAEASKPKFTGIGAGIGMGLAIVGAGVGIGLVGHAALSGIARQPEQAGTIRGTMILLAALVEGAALIVVVFCLVLALIAS